MVCRFGLLHLVRQNPTSLPIWVHLILIVGGAASILIGGGMSLLAALVTRLLAGRADAHPAAFGGASWVSPVLAFIAARYVLIFVRSLV